MNGSVQQADWRRNALLARLPENEYQKVAARLEPAEYTVRTEIHARHKPIEWVYFPLDAVFSVVESVDEHDQVEVTTIGNDGVVGLAAFLGSVHSPQTTFCQVAGTALRMRVSDLFAVLADDGSLHRMFQLYAQALIAQLSRNVVCNRMHSARQRASRWLLLTHDRVDRERVQLTQEFLAQMLGVRRTTISDIARDLANDGLIRYARGVIEILDRAGLETTSCECYQIIQEQTEEILNSAQQEGTIP